MQHPQPKAKYLVALAMVLLFLAIPVNAQSTAKIQWSSQEAQAPEYWVDPSTQLIWAGTDNGRDVTWGKAVKYCRKLNLGGFSDWRLADLEELEGIYDKDANSSGLMGPSGKGTAATWHVKGNLFLTGVQWSSTRRMDDRGRPSGYAYRFDFNEGREFGGDEVSFYTNKRALCVRP